MEGKIQRTFVRQEAYAKLRNWILDGTLPPGTQLRDKELAEQLGVSRTPIREALLRLEDEGLVKTKPNRSTLVSHRGIMDAKISIYLAGSIKKGHERADESFWTDADMLFLKQALSEYEVSFLNPAFRSDDLSDQRAVFGRDMTQVFCSDVVFVDARDRRGLGVGAEMMWAKFHKIPMPHDEPMKTLISANQKLHSRIWEPKNEQEPALFRS